MTNHALLLVDDDHVALSLMEMVFEESGYEVVLATTVEAALQAAAKQEFALLITDISLPDGNGVELMKEIQTIRPTKGISISGYDPTDEMRSAGFAAHVTKPVDYEKIADLVKEVIGE